MNIKRAHLLSGFVLAACALVASPAPAQTQSLGLVGKTAEAHIGDAAALEGSSVYSGDYLSTSENGTMLVQIGTLSLELQGSSAAHLYRAPYGAVLELNRGTVLYTTPGGQQNLVIFASDVRVTPSLSNSDSGRVTIDDPCDVTVESRRGEADVRVGSENRKIEQGKAYRVHAENQISYREYLSPEADDYHKHHEHTPCAALDMAHGHMPIAPGQSRFLLVTAALAGTGTGIGILKAMESPDRP